MTIETKNFDDYFWGLLFPRLFSDVEHPSLNTEFVEMITSDDAVPFEVAGSLLEFIETGEADILRSRQTWMILTDKLSANTTRFFWYCYSFLAKIITPENFVSGMSELYMARDLKSSLQTEILDKCYHINHDVADQISENYEDTELLKLVRAYVLLKEKGQIRRRAR